MSCTSRKFSSWHPKVLSISDLVDVAHSGGRAQSVPTLLKTLTPLLHDPGSLAAHGLTRAEQQLLAQGKLRPMFVLFGTDGGVRALQAPVPSEDQKASMSAFVRTAAIAKGARTLITMMETWTDADQVDVPLSERADREEWVLVMLTSRGTTELIQRARMARILRDTRGTITGFEAIDRGPMTGRLLDLLPPRDLPKAARRKAQKMLGKSQRTLTTTH